MTKDDILRIQDYFVQGAIRAKKAGYDGVEIHGAQLSLVSLFSSTKFNRRNDEYGGSDENRSRFIVEIVKKIREAIGNDMIISAKIDSVDEQFGFTESGFLTLGKALEKAGLDLIEISGPNPIRTGEDPYFYNDTKKLAEIINIPVICIGGIKKYEQADFILKNSKIEYIAMSRELLKQPDIVKKWVLNK
jgi:2,4-dienoyl-CoA reductase-like NADH-dependent reductase (Old Yellow Enzyme family)